MSQNDSNFYFLFCLYSFRTKNLLELHVIPFNIVIPSEDMNITIHI